MRYLRGLYLRIQRAVFRRAQDDRDLEDELRFHLAEEINLRVARGVPLADATRQARLALGSVALAKENTRAVWVSTAIEQLLQDFRIGCRILTKSPWLSATAVTLVTLVIGGNATLFSFAHGILTKPALGVHDSEHLATLSWRAENGWVEPGSSYINYIDLARENRTLRSLLAFDYERFTLSHRNGTHAVWGVLASPNYFETLGVPISPGRSFSTSDDERSTAGLVVVISHRLWQDQFQGASDISGTPMTVNGQPATIIGVAAPPFRGSLLNPLADVWLPVVGYSRQSLRQAMLLGRSDIRFSMIGRLAPGVSLSEARAELTRKWNQLQRAFPDVRQDLALTVVPYSGTAGGNSLVSMRGNTFLAIFQIVTFLTLVIVCANVANLLVARAVVRQREMALRQSLGASRVRIVRMLLSEGLVLSLLSWAAAWVFAWWVSKAVSQLVIPSLESSADVPALDFTPDWTVAGYAMVLAIVGMIAFTVAPALRLWRQELLPWLKSGEQGVVRGRSRLSSALVVVQLAFSVLLLTIAGLAYRSILLFGSVDLGFSTGNVLLVTVNTSGSAQNPNANRAVLNRLRDRLSSLPGVDSVTYARVPAKEYWLNYPVQSLSSTDPRHAEGTYVSADYLRAIGVMPLAGREFEVQEGVRSTKGVVVNRRLADSLWPGQSALGQTLRVGPRSDFEAVLPAREYEVVGVMPNGYFSGYRREQPNFVLFSAEQEPSAPGETTFYVRSPGTLDTLAPAIRAAVRDADSGTAIVRLLTLAALFEQGSLVWPVRTLTILLTLFAGLSLLIAGIGQYAVVAFDMRRRVREFGLRIALGASSRQVLTSVVGDGMRLTAIGLAVGFTLSMAVGNALRGLLYGITPTDAVTYTGVFALLAASSLAACYVPARRAARIDPNTALRDE